MGIKGKVFVLAAVILVALLLVVSPYARADSEGAPTLGNATGRDAVSGVAVAIPAVRPATLTGFTRPRRTMTLVSEESARCLEVKADVGDVIGEDGVFAHLDPVFIELEIARIRADEARLESEADYNAKQLKRFKNLVESKTAAQQDLDDWSRRMRAAREQLNARKLEERIQLEHLNRYTIKAPAGWRVLERYAEPGEWLSNGQAVAELGDFRTLLVPLALTPFEYNWLKSVNRTVEMYLPDQDRIVYGHVELVSPDFDPQTRKINIDIEVEKGLEEMRGGVRVEVPVDMPDEHGGVILPKEAVQVRYDEYFVTPVLSDGSDGEPLRVNLLGRNGQGDYRLSSPKIRAGQKFRTRN